MSTAELKLYLNKVIVETEDVSILKKIKTYITSLSKEKDWWDELSKAEKASIERGIAQADRGELIPHEQVMKEIKSKFKL